MLLITACYFGRVKRVGGEIYQFAARSAWQVDCRRVVEEWRPLFFNFKNSSGFVYLRKTSQEERKSDDDNGGGGFDEGITGAELKL